MPADGEIGVQLRAVEYRVLGPLTVVVDGRALKLGGPRQRTVLAILLSRVNRTVSQDRLIDLVWQGDPPEAAKATLQSYIYGLRREVCADVIVRQGDGYRVATDEEHFDALRFERMVAGGQAQVAADPERALDALTGALSLWCGTPFSGLDGNTSLVAEIARLDALRLSAVEHRIDARLAVGDHAGALAELETLVREHPLRERFRAQQMLALYRAGRQAEALRAYQETRRYLVEELGIEPATELRQLEQQILDQDPGLAGPEPAGRRPVASRGAQVVRGYELRDAIGSGAYGIVRRAYQPSVGREVAIKVIRPECANDPLFVRRFEREARTVAQLEHPHVVPLFDFWRDPDGAYLVMPHLRGGSLAGALGKGGWHLEPAIQLVQQVGSALAYAHRRGVIHRDLKAANVLLDEEGNAYLTDFGIATMGASSSGSDGSGDVVPPERSAGGEHSALSDQFCLAMLAYQMLTGVLPSTALPLAPITEARPGLGSDLADVLSRATSTDPCDRYPSVDAFLRALRRSVGVDVIAIADPGARRTDATLRNPYKGLRSFHEDDSADFFGRDGAIAELQAALAAHNVVTVVGPSGCGKSSLVRAGLVPSLRAGAVVGSRDWLFADMYPGTHPVEELERALLSVAIDRPSELGAELYESEGLLRVAKRILPDDDSTLVLIVDQFEELFSLTGSDTARNAIIDSITSVAGLADSPVKIVLTLRADFFDRPLAYPALRAAIAPGVVTVAPPSRDGLIQAIIAPTRAVGLDIEPGLVGRILADVETQPGALPLLQFALTELFDQRSGDALTIADYVHTGGIVGALSRRAEDLYAHLGVDAREAATHVFLRLVTVDEGSPDSRRRVRLSEMRSLNIDQGAVDEVLHRFGGARLLTFDRDPVTRGPTIEVAHEALLSEWTRLASWLDARRESLVQARRLRLATSEWEQSGCDPSFLLRGGRLEQAVELTRQGDAALTSEEIDFLDASTRGEALDVMAARRRRRAVAGLLVAGLAVVLVLGGLALAQRDEALRRTEATVIRGLVADAQDVVASDPDLALLLGLEAIEMAGSNPDHDLRRDALDLLGAAIRSQRVVLRPDVRGRNVDIAADGSLLAIGQFGNVHVLSVASGEQIAVLDGDRPVADVEFDPDSRRLAVVHPPATPGEPSEVVIWDARAWRQVATLSGRVSGAGSRVSWSPDGDALALLAWTTDSNVSIFDVTQGVETHHVEVGDARDVAFADSRTVVLTHPDREAVELFDLKTSRLQPLKTPGVAPDAIDLDTRAGRMAVVGRDPLRLQMWDVQTGAQIWSVYLRQPFSAAAPSVAVNAHGRQVAASFLDGVGIFDADTGVEVAAIDTGGPIVRELRFTREGHRLVGVAGDGEVIVWDTSSAGYEAIAAGPAAACGVNVSPDDQRVLVTGVDGTVTVVDLATGATVLSVPHQRVNHEQQVTVSRDWRHMAWVDEHGESWVRDATTGKRLVQLPDCLTPKAFSLDGSMLLLDRRCPGHKPKPDAHGLVVVDSLTGREVVTLEGGHVWGRAAAFTRVPGYGDREFLVVDVDGVIRIHDMPSGKLVASLTGPGVWVTLAVDPDGRHLAASTEAHAVEVFDLAAVVDGRSMDEARLVTLDVGSEALGLALDGHGRLSAASRNSLQVFDLESQRLIAAPDVATDTPPFAAFSPNGEVLVYHDDGPVLRRQYLEPEHLIGVAQERVTRSFTTDECQRYFGRPCS